MEKIVKVKVEKNLEESNARARAGHLNIQAIRELDEEGEETDRAEVPETISTSSPNK